MKYAISLVVFIALALVSVDASASSKGKHKGGLRPQAAAELRDANVDKYVGKFKPAVSFPVGDGWVKHTYDPGAALDGPICIAGSPYSVFSRQRDPSKLLIMLQGGGACWQDFYNCNIFSESQEPPAPQAGIWDDVSGLNPLDDWSVVYMPYCDGSVFSGDNDVPDASWQAFVEAILGLPAGSGPPARFHRGLRNVTAGIDLARHEFPHAGKILVAGSSAGGVGASAFTPFLARMAFGNDRKLMVFNDAGPVAVNLADTGAIAQRAADWKFGQFYPASCTHCDVFGQGTALIKWRLKNDRTIREAFYSTDFDLTNRFFMNLLPSVPPGDPVYEMEFLLTGLAYRALVIGEHGEIHDRFPSRYRRFIRAATFTHTALQTLDFYESADGVPLFAWLDGFVSGKRSVWKDIVEELPSP